MLMCGGYLTSCTRHRVGKSSCYCYRADPPSTSLLLLHLSQSIPALSNCRQTSLRYSSWRTIRRRWTTLRFTTSTGKHKALSSFGCPLKLTFDSYNHHGMLYRLRISHDHILTLAPFYQEFTRKCWCVPGLECIFQELADMID